MVCLFVYVTRHQGTESSDLSLISDFILTPRAILEISVNLKRNFFRGWGYGYWGKMTQKKHWNAPPAALESQNFLGEDPQTPLEKNIQFTYPLPFRVHLPLNLTLRTFQTFLPKSILAPGHTPFRCNFRFNYRCNLTHNDNYGCNCGRSLTRNKHWDRHNCACNMTCSENVKVYVQILCKFLAKFA